MEKLKVLGVDCKNCAAHVQEALDGVKGISNLEIRLDEKIAFVSFDPAQISKQDITEKVEDVGFDVE